MDNSHARETRRAKPHLISNYSESIKMSVCPNWIDKQFSEALPNLRSQGEGQDLEFKSTFPLQARELVKEVAAFATSNSGTILLEG